MFNVHTSIGIDISYFCDFTSEPHVSLVPDDALTSTWRERIIHFSPSWFTVCMGTGAMSQVLVNFPYPYSGNTRWMRDLGYCFWILDIVLFITFTTFSVIRYVRYPALLRIMLLEFPASSFLGAVPTTVNTIIVGLVFYYDYSETAAWVAFVLFWISVVLTIFTGVVLILIQMFQERLHTMNDVAGVWLMTAVPNVITAAAGAVILPYLYVINEKAAVSVLVVCFLLWGLGMSQIHMILAIYFWRLISKKTPSQRFILSGYMPIAALGQASLAIYHMSIFFCDYLQKSRFVPTHSRTVSDQTLAAIGEMIYWFGLLTALFLLAHASFWLVQNTTAFIYAWPMPFNIGWWSFTFPFAAYTNGWAVVARDFRNEGMRGWAAMLGVLCIIFWFYVATFTAYLGFWKGSMFYDPALADWSVKEKEVDAAGGMAVQDVVVERLEDEEAGIRKSVKRSLSDDSGFSSYSSGESLVDQHGRDSSSRK
ncbi:hypothetical protein M501DRAFT_1060716 [Patellaria atrata CBS 101060]|uniref:C4-dicarboxylate transporter/malic acid transport protein n=1 Tax=Patellaria atrata CBS 101060 TaxID=1346257 RepID=A0A9P4S5T6_9PEZI|nr:hypothetical protein M501DRAFT_1060716 [Patellaria atrata CBS 101060]